MNEHKHKNFLHFIYKNKFSNKNFKFPPPAIVLMWVDEFHIDGTERGFFWDDDDCLK